MKGKREGMEGKRGGRAGKEERKGGEGVCVIGIRGIDAPGRRYCDASHSASVCVCVRISVGGEGNALYPVFSSLFFIR